MCILSMNIEIDFVKIEFVEIFENSKKVLNSIILDNTEIFAVKEVNFWII